MHRKHIYRRYEEARFAPGGPGEQFAGGSESFAGPRCGPRGGGGFGPGGGGGPRGFGHRGGGPFGGGGFGGPGYGPRGGGPRAGRGRRRRGEIRQALLLLLAEEPRNGYQLMQAIEERSGGRWSPSPGSIYPTLAQLEDEGLIKATEKDGGKVFELTDQGREHVQEQPDRTPPWEDADEPGAFADMRTEARQLFVASRQVAQAGNADQVARAAKALAEARRTIYGILAEDSES